MNKKLLLAALFSCVMGSSAGLEAHRQNCCKHLCPYCQKVESECECDHHQECGCECDCDCDDCEDGDHCDQCDH